MSKFNFMNNKNHKKKPRPSKGWKVLIADDEPEVHTITKTVLSNLEFENLKLEFLSSYNGEETIEMVKQNPDIAIIILDVVMESDDTGLFVAKMIRDQLNNHLIRIILRTGQPGSAPEKEVIHRYEINDYKEKTELTTIKLYTTIMSALRTFRDLRTIEHNKKSLQKILETSQLISQLPSLQSIAENILMELISIIHLNNSLFSDKPIEGFITETTHGQPNIIASTENLKYKSLKEICSNKTIESFIQQSIQQQESFCEMDLYVGYLHPKQNTDLTIVIINNQEFNGLTKNLIELFYSNLTITFNKIYFNNYNTTESVLSTVELSLNNIITLMHKNPEQFKNEKEKKQVILEKLEYINTKLTVI